jgi:hypothetical protein
LVLLSFLVELLAEPLVGLLVELLVELIIVVLLQSCDIGQRKRVGFQWMAKDLTKIN